MLVNKAKIISFDCNTLTVYSTVYLTFVLISQHFYRSVKETTAILRTSRNFTWPAYRFRISHTVFVLLPYTTNITTRARCIVSRKNPLLFWSSIAWVHYHFVFTHCHAMSWYWMVQNMSLQSERHNTSYEYVTIIIHANKKCYI